MPLNTPVLASKVKPLGTLVRVREVTVAIDPWVKLWESRPRHARRTRSAGNAIDRCGGNGAGADGSGSHKRLDEKRICFTRFENGISDLQRCDIDVGSSEQLKNGDPGTKI